MKTNPRTIWAALTWLDDQIHRTGENWHNECDGLQARGHGWAHSGEATAKIHFESIPKSDYLKAPAPGCLAFWGGNGAGHVITMANKSWGYSNDILRDGRVDYVRKTRIDAEWKLPFLGYTLPSFPHGSGRTPLPPDTTLDPLVSVAVLKHSKRTGTSAPDVLKVQRRLAKVLNKPEHTTGVWDKVTANRWRKWKALTGRVGIMANLRALGSATSCVIPVP